MLHECRHGKPAVLQHRHAYRTSSQTLGGIGAARGFGPKRALTWGVATGLVVAGCRTVVSRFVSDTTGIALGVSRSSVRTPHVEALDGHSETGFDDVTFDLIPLQYHSLKAGHDYGQYVRDARNAGKDEIAAFFEHVMSQDSDRAQKCHEFL